MTKVSKKTKSDDVHSHIVNAFEIINEFLPNRYVPKVLKNLAEKGQTSITGGVIRNVKAGGAEKCTNLTVLNALLEVANDNKKALADIGGFWFRPKAQERNTGLHARGKHYLS